MSLVIPKASRPIMIGYGISHDPEGLIEWDWVREQITQAKNYWICTTRPDGRPHATPVWGGVVEDIFYFSSGKDSVKAQNLAQRPELVLHLESGDDCVIIEGHAQITTDLQLAARLAPIYDAKYPYKPSAEDLVSAGLYGVQPDVVIAWKETDFRKTATRWVFKKT